MMNESPEVRWPRPMYDHGRQPHFLFIVTPPMSGSTAISELLNTSHRTMILQERAEGQWLIPGLCEDDRWDTDKYVDYRSVRAVWLNRYQMVQRLVGNVDVVIEKSPPNMVRIKRLASKFESCSFLVNNRHPVASCASIFRRLNGLEKMDDETRSEHLDAIANQWMERSGLLRRYVKNMGWPMSTYEEFCADPSSVIDKLDLPPGVVESIDIRAEVEVKNRPSQAIENRNDRHLEVLRDDERDKLSSVFTEEKGLIRFFGYAD